MLILCQIRLSIALNSPTEFEHPGLKIEKKILLLKNLGWGGGASNVRVIQWAKIKIKKIPFTSLSCFADLNPLRN